VGDLVTIINDAHKVQQLQKGHGEWIDIMRYVSYSQSPYFSFLSEYFCKKSKIKINYSKKNLDVNIKKKIIQKLAFNSNDLS